LSNANIVIGDPDGNDPVSIVQYAEAELMREPDYDRAYCVFDRDGHSNYESALRRAAESQFGKSGRLHAIPSIPCFEVWLLLHFAYSTAPFNSADAVVRQLRRSFPEYAKGYQRCFEHLTEKLETAIAHATRLEAHNLDAGSDNPATRMHQLVKYLRGLK
jgi:RloB-like protein